MLRSLLALVIVALAPAAYAADAEQMETNKKTVLEFYDAAINQKNFEAAAKFLGPRYIQHNPRAADGPEGLKAFLAFLREKFPDYHSDIRARQRAFNRVASELNADCYDDVPRTCASQRLFNQVLSR
jgi:SnoaL-like polyketide cyclase